MSRLLVTGGLGFMGSDFVWYLVENHPGDEVVVFDALSYSGRRENLEGIGGKVTTLVRDLRDRKAIDEALEGVDAVFHFGAETHINRSIADPKPFIESNVVGTFNLLEAARKMDTERLIFISSSEVYGTAMTVPMDESHPLNCQSPYAATKVAGDRLCFSYYQTYGMPILILRPFNNFGPRQFPEKLIPFFILRALHDQFLPVYGDGQYSRDYTYVFDFCEAVDRAGKVDKKGEVINVATGKDEKVIDIAHMILDHIGKPSDLIRHVEDRPGHVRRLVGSYEKAKRILGWEPATPFEEGLKKTVDWYLHNEAWWKPLSDQFMKVALPWKKS
ncbi:MAG: dTDP-glucose 4,6-dehydratase [Candidatus Bathyarchaeia archaeon]